MQGWHGAGRQEELGATLLPIPSCPLSAQSQLWGYSGLLDSCPEPWEPGLSPLGMHHSKLIPGPIICRSHQLFKPGFPKGQGAWISMNLGPLLPQKPQSGCPVPQQANTTSSIP